MADQTFFLEEQTLTLLEKVSRRMFLLSSWTATVPSRDNPIPSCLKSLGECTVMVPATRSYCQERQKNHDDDRKFNWRKRQQITTRNNSRLVDKFCWALKDGHPAKHSCLKLLQEMGLAAKKRKDETEDYLEIWKGLKKEHGH